MNAETELVAIAKKWDKAIATNDMKEMKKYMAEEWTCLSGMGISQGSSFLASIAGGDLVHTVMDTDEIHVKVFGDTGIVIAKGISAGSYKGEPFRLYEWSTSVFIKKENRWICVHTMLTPADKEQ